MANMSKKKFKMLLNIYTQITADTTFEEFDALVADIEEEMPKLYAKYEKNKQKAFDKVTKRIKCLGDGSCKKGIPQRVKNAAKNAAKE